MPTEIGLFTRLGNEKIARVYILDVFAICSHTHNVQSSFWLLYLCLCFYIYILWMRVCMCSESLSLEGNLLTGSLPTELGLCTRLRSLTLGKNELSGELPSELGQLFSLRTVSLDGNRFTGTVPSDLCDWKDRGVAYTGDFCPQSTSNLGCIEPGCLQ